jgi:hypothetical protein
VMLVMQCRWEGCMMKVRDACGMIATMVGLLLVSAPSAQAETPSLASPDRLEAVVAVRDVEVRDASVSGRIVNKSPRLLRDVKLIVRHTWHWRDERHPGDDSPGRSEEFTVPGEAPPGGSLPFSYRLDPPLSERTDGHFATSAEVVGFTEVGN